MSAQQDSFHSAPRDAARRVTADGYTRRCPVQTLREPPDYRRRLVRRIVGAAALLAAALIGLEMLVRLGFFGR